MLHLSQDWKSQLIFFFYDKNIVIQKRKLYVGPTRNAKF